MAEGKADTAEAMRRVAEIEEKLLSGESRAEIVRFCTNKYGLAARQIDKYMVRARQQLRKSINERTELSINWHIRARKRLLREANDQRDTRSALSVLRDIGELQGFYVEKHEVTGKDGAPIEYIKLPETARE